MFAILQEERNVVRVPATDRVTIRQGSNCFDGRLRDISVEGCCAIIPGALASNAPVFIAVEGFAPVEARVIWAAENHYGLRYTGESQPTFVVVPTSPPVTECSKHSAGRQSMTGYGSGAPEGPAMLGSIAAALVMAGSCAIASTFEGLVARLKGLRR